MFESRQSSASRLPIHVFWLVAIATQINFNHLSNMIIGSGWFVSLGLAVCCIYMFLAVRIPFRLALGFHGYLIIASLISYLVIGMSVTFLTGAAWHMEEYGLPFRVCLSVMIIVASAFGAWVVLQRIEIERLLTGILLIQAVACILILMSPWLVEYVYRSLTISYQYLGENRFMGSFKGPNLAASMACYTVVSALALSNGRHRMLAWGVAILGSAAVLLTFSRAAVMTLVLVYFFFLWSSISIYRLKLTSAGIWLFVICAVGFLMLVVVNAEYLPLNDGQMKRMQWFVSFEPVKEVDTRSILLPLSISYIAESPIFGHGLTQFHLLEHGPGCSAEGGSDRVTCGSHNTYLMLWGEAGILPVALYSIFVGSLFWIRLALPKSVITDTVAGWSLVLAIASMSADEIAYSAWHSFIIGLSCALAAHAFRESRRRRAERTPETRSVLALNSGV